MIFLRYKVLRWVVGFALMMLVLWALVLLRSFYPARRVELSAEDNKHRLFAQSLPSPDGNVLVKVVDWPHTFIEPIVLGEANWPEKYASSELYWSADGTLAVWRVRGVSEEFERNEAAYDFRYHRKIGPILNASEKTFNAKIDALVQERGGLQLVPVEVPGLNSGMFE